MSDKGISIRLGLLLALLGMAAACTAMQLRERFSPLQGQVAPVRAKAEGDGDREGDEDRDVALYFERAPEGFALVAEEPVVQVGYEHVVLGRIDLMPDDGDCQPEQKDVLGREHLFALMRERAYREGGNAVIFISTESDGDAVDDCTRLSRRKEAGYRERPWATGYVVRVAAERPLEGLSELPDGGMEDAGPDAHVGTAIRPEDLPAPPPLLPPAPPPAPAQAKKKR